MGRAGLEVRDGRGQPGVAFEGSQNRAESKLEDRLNPCEHPAAHKCNLDQ